MKRKQRSPAGPRRRNWDTEEQQRVERLQRVAACTRRSSLMASSAYSRRVMDSRRRSAAIEGRVTDEERAVALVEAAAIDDIAAMEQIADAGARIDVADPGGRYAVHVAAASGKLAAIGWLVQHAADVSPTRGLGDDAPAHVELPDASGMTPMHFAAAHGQVPALCYLQRLGASIDAVNAHGETVLHMAVYGGHADAVTKVIQFEAGDRGDSFDGDADGDGDGSRESGAGDGNGAEGEGEDGRKHEARGLVAARAMDGRTALHWAAAAGQDAALEALVRGGADVNARDAQGLPPLQLALMGQHASTLRLLAELGADIEAETDTGSSLLHASLVVQKGNQGPSLEILHTVIELGHAVSLDVITRAVDYRLWPPAQSMMHAYIKSESIVTEKVIAFIQRHIPQPEARFDDCILYSPWPLWTCLVVLDVLEQASAHSVTQQLLWKSLIDNYVQKAIAMCQLLHGPEEEDRRFKDAGRISLKDILEPNVKALGALAISRRGPIEIALERHYSGIFETHAIQKYLAFKWKGGRELNSKLDRLAEEVLARSSLPPNEWTTTLWMTRLLLAATLAVFPVDDSSLTLRLGSHKRCPPVMKRILQNQGVRCRQMFAIPQIRFFIEIWPQLCMMFLYTFGEPEHIGSFLEWKPENKLFGYPDKAPLRRGEILFSCYLAGLLLSECQQASHNLRQYFADAFNIFDIIVLCNFISVVVLRVYANQGRNGDPIDPDLLMAINILMSVGGTCLWLRLLEIFGIHPKLGPLLEMIKKMIKDLVTFLVLLNFVIMGFSEAFYFLFQSIPNYSTFRRTYLTLLSNLLGEELTFNDFDQLADPTMSTLGISLLIVYLMIAAILLLTLLIAMLSDNFRRMSDNIHAQWTWGKASLVQRVSDRADLTHPPFNIIQPLFSVVGNKQQELPPGYPVEALFIPHLGGSDGKNGGGGGGGGKHADEDAGGDDHSATAGAAHGLNSDDRNTLGGGAWYPAVVKRAPRDIQLGTLSGFVSSDWGYLSYHVQFDDRQIEKFNRTGAVPVRGRRGHGPFPLLLMYGRREARYLLDLLGFWPVAYYVVNVVWLLCGPYIVFVMTWLSLQVLKREANWWVAWLVALPLYCLLAAGLYAASFAGMVVVWSFWSLQLYESMRKIARGGVRFRGALERKSESEASSPAAAAAGGAAAKRKPDDASRGHTTGTPLAVKAKSASEKRRRAETIARTARRRAMQRIKKRCRYMTREQLDVVLGTTALATSITEYDKKTQKEILLIGDTVKDLDELLGHMERQTDEFELQVTAELEQRGNKVREILGEVQRGAGATNGESRDARGGSDAVVDESAGAGGGTGVDGAGGAGTALKRRRGESASSILERLQSTTFKRALARFEADMATRARRESRRRTSNGEGGSTSAGSSGGGAGDTGRRLSRKFSAIDRRKASRAAV